jgi:hypothetical protein
MKSYEVRVWELLGLEAAKHFLVTVNIFCILVGGVRAGRLAACEPDGWRRASRTVGGYVDCCPPYVRINVTV